MAHVIDTRLDDELAQARRELAEARELQAASAQVLRVISTSAGNVGPVFDTIAQIAVHLCQGQFSFVLRLEDGVMHFGAYQGPTRDRKSTRLNSSHLGISYAVFCLKKK